MSREFTVRSRDERANEDVVEIATGLTCRSRIPKASRNSGAYINSTGLIVGTFWRFTFINFLKEKFFRWAGTGNQSWAGVKDGKARD